MGQSRIYVFMVGVEQSTQPDPGTPSADADVVPYSWLIANYGKARRVTNTWGSPYSAQAGTSIAHGLQSTETDCLMYLKGNSGAVNMTADPQIAAGTRDGQRLVLIFTSDTDTVLLEDGTGLAMPNGNVRSASGTVLEFSWDSGQSLWRNTFWNNVGGIV